MDELMVMSYLFFILSIFTNNHYNSGYKYFNIQEQIIIYIKLEGHSREGTNASPFHDSANNFSEKNITIFLVLTYTYSIIVTGFMFFF